MVLKPKDEKVISALLQCGSVTETEKITGVSRSTIYKRLSDDNFRAEYDRRRAMVLDEACNVLKASLSEAVNEVRGIMLDTKNAPQVRLNAAGLILQNCLKYVEQHEIITRLENLETIVKESNGEQ